MNSCNSKLFSSFLLYQRISSLIVSFFPKSFTIALSVGTNVRHFDNCSIYLSREKLNKEIVTARWSKARFIIMLMLVLLKGRGPIFDDDQHCSLFHISRLKNNNVNQLISHETCCH